MVFCGQCGFRLNPGTKQCPQCGALVEPGAFEADETPPDAPTTVTPSLPTQMQTQAEATRAGDPNMPPQHLILRPGQDAGSYNYGTQDAYEATRRVDASDIDYGATTRRQPASDPSNMYTGYPQSGSGYPPQNTYAGQGQNAGNYAPQGPSYPGFGQQGMGYQPVGGQGQARAATVNTNSRGRAAALLIILVGLLFMLVAITLFILQHNGVFGSSNNFVVATAWTLPAQISALKS